MIKYLLLLAGLFITCKVNAQFSGSFAPANWTTTYLGSTAGPTVNTAGAPSSVFLQGPEDQDFEFGLVRWSIVLNQAQQISFDYNITGADNGDDVFFVSRGAQEVLLETSNPGDSSFTSSFSAGDTLVLSAVAQYNIGTPIVITLSNFVSSVALPVTGSQLSLRNDNGRSVLLWETYTEKNNKGFEMQRSFDGSTFETVGFVASQAPGGNSNTLLRYVYDIIPASGITYYRYKQSDADHVYYSNIVKAKPSGVKEAKIAAIPNPARTTLKFVYENDALQKSTELKIRLTDITGRTVLHKLMPVTSGGNEIALDISGIAPGSYYLSYSNEDNDINGSLKIVKE